MAEIDRSLDTDDEDAVGLIVASCGMLYAAGILRENRRRRHSSWVSGYLLNRPEFGAYNSLMRDIQLCEPDKNYVRMDCQTFEMLFSKIEHLISAQDTNFRQVRPMSSSDALTCMLVNYAVAEFKIYMKQLTFNSAIRI